MHFDMEKMELLELSALLIAANKRFTDALKAKRPHSELIQLYNDIQEIYYQIKHLKERKLVAA
jgi:hypothetical protein